MFGRLQKHCQFAGLCKSRYCFGILWFSVVHYQVPLSSLCHIHVGMAAEMREGLQFRLVIFLCYKLPREKMLGSSVVVLILFCAAQTSRCENFDLCIFIFVKSVELCRYEYDSPSYFIVAFVLPTAQISFILFGFSCFLANRNPFVNFTPF